MHEFNPILCTLPNSISLVLLHHAIVFTITLLYSPLSAFEAKTFYGNDTDRDRLALLGIKDQILDNHFGVVKKWNDFFHFCTGKVSLAVGVTKK